MNSGHALLYSVTRSNFGGQDVTANLATLLNMDKDIAGTIKVPLSPLLSFASMLTCCWVELLGIV